MNFRQYPSMTRCEIPNSVQLTNTNMINSFRNMYKLISSNLPNSVTSMQSTY